jgi:hypothetical protein
MAAGEIVVAFADQDFAGDDQFPFQGVMCHGSSILGDCIFQLTISADCCAA